MSVRLVCAICGHELIRAGITNQLRCPLHGSRGIGALTEPGGMRPGSAEIATAIQPLGDKGSPGSLSPPSKPSLRDPDYDFGTSTDG